MYGVEPLAPAALRRRRLVGAVVVIASVAVVVGLHVNRQQGRRGYRDAAFSALAKGDFEAAQRMFRRGVGTVGADPLCVLGLAVLQELQARRDTLPPAAPRISELDELSAVAYAHRLLTHGRPQQAEFFARDALARFGRSDALTRIRGFSRGWLNAIAAQ